MTCLQLVNNGTVHWKGNRKILSTISSETKCTTKEEKQKKYLKQSTLLYIYPVLKVLTLTLISTLSTINSSLYLITLKWSYKCCHSSCETLNQHNSYIAMYLHMMTASLKLTVYNLKIQTYKKNTTCSTRSIMINWLKHELFMQL